MKPIQVFLSVSTATSAFVVWLYIVTQLPTNGKNYATIVLFFLSLTIWFAALLSYLIYTYRLHTGNNEIKYAIIGPAIRHGSICAFTLSLILLLKVFHIVGLWEIILVIGGALCFEIALGSHHKEGRQS